MLQKALQSLQDQQQLSPEEIAEALGSYQDRGFRQGVPSGIHMGKMVGVLFHFLLMGGWLKVSLDE